MISIFKSVFIYSRPVLLVCFATFLSGQIKVKEQNGHISPLRAKITLVSGKTREVLVVATGSGYQDQLTSARYSHVFFVKTDDGISKRTLWLDSIASLTGLDSLRTSRSEFTITMKNGSSISATLVAHTGDGDCDRFFDLPSEPPEASCSYLTIANEDESTEMIDIRRLKSVEFLPAPRKDKLANAMFSTWKYSPFTGEKLAPAQLP